MSGETANASGSAAALATAAPKPDPFAWWPHAKTFQGLSLRVASVVMWCYAAFQLFIFDVDIAFINAVAPEWMSVLSYKLPALLFALALLLFTVPLRRLAFWWFFVFIYPFFLLGKLLFVAGILIVGTKSWNVGLFVANGVFAFFRSVKWKFIAFAAALVCSLLVLAVSYPPVLILAASVLLGLNAASIWKEAYRMFNPPPVLQIHTKVTNWILKQIKELAQGETAPQEPVVLSNLGADGKKKWGDRLGHAVVFREFCYFWASRVTEYKKSRLYIAGYVFAALKLAVITILLFAFINLAGYKIDHTEFQAMGAPTFFDFFHYSFAALGGQQIPQLVALAPMPVLLAMIETAFGVVIFTVFFSVLFAVRQSADDDSVQNAVEALGAQAEEAEAYIARYFAFSLEQAVNEMDRLQTGLTTIAGYFRKGQLSKGQLLEEPRG